MCNDDDYFNAEFSPDLDVVSEREVTKNPEPDASDVEESNMPYLYTHNTHI